MLLTKHCSPEAREWMLNGHFKLGSHKEYSGGLATGALSDTAEGKSCVSVKGDLIGFTGPMGGAMLRNVSLINCNRSIVYNASINSMMFCASDGDYSPERHNATIAGNPAQGYEANPNYTSYLTLDAEKLKAALTAATDQFFGVRTHWIGIRVQYGERNKIVDAKTFKGISTTKSWSPLPIKLH